MSRAITRHQANLATDDPALRLEQTERIERATRELLRDGMPLNTLLAYQGDFQHFEAWCAEQQPPFDARPATEPAIMAYLNELAEARKPGGAFQVKVGTIERRLSGIAWAHALDNYSSPRTPRIAKVLHAIKVRRARAGERPPRRAAPLLLADLRKICKKLDEHQHHAAVRDRALLLLGWVCALRRSEIAALDLEDVGDMVRDGFTLTIRRSKADQEGQGKVLPVARESGALCPVQAMQAWLEIRGTAKGALFFRSWRSKIHADQRVSEKQVARTVHRLVKNAGIKPEMKELDFSAHSLRAGFITEAVRAGQRDGDVMDRSRHRSHDVFMGYVRIAQTFEKNAARGLLSDKEDDDV